MIGKENGDKKTKKNMTYSSLPSPEDLAAYREILEDALERIFETVERDKIITRRIAGVSIFSIIAYAFILALKLIAEGQQNFAAVAVFGIAITGVASINIAFIRRRKVF